MRTKKVNRYWCDFCNKAGLSAGAMTKHEAHCTLNPARSCRVCTLINGGGHVGAERMAELVAILPDPAPYLDQAIYSCRCKDCCPSSEFQEPGPCQNEHRKLTQALETAMAKLREETDNCPACILAALRQAKIPVPMADGFDFKTEMKAVFDEYNANRDEGYY